MWINTVIILREDLLTDHQSIKRRSEFTEYFIPDCYHPYYYWNVQIYIYLVYEIILAMTNYTCVKSSMAPHIYKVFSTHGHEISGWTILSTLLDSYGPCIGGMNGDVQSNIATLTFNNGVQLEYFHGIILRLQQEINLYG